MRAADHRDLAAVLVRQFHRNADAMNRGREAGEEQLLLGLREKISSSRGRTARSLGV